MEALHQPSIRVIAVIAEGVPEADTKQLIAYAARHNKIVLGPATVGGLQVLSFCRITAHISLLIILSCTCSNNTAWHVYIPDGSVTSVCVTFDLIPKILPCPWLVCIARLMLQPWQNKDAE